MTLPSEQLKRLQAMEKRYNELEIQMADSAVASDPEQLKTIGKEFSKLELPCSLFRKHTELKLELEKLTSDVESEPDDEMKVLYQDEMESLSKKLQDLESEIDAVLTREETSENRPAILEIRSGTGGEEAALFAGDLYRMYSRFTENRGWKLETLSASPSSRGGFKEVVFAVKGDDAYNNLKYESGVHRVQRVPLTEASGRIHTSAATVAVLIEPDEVEVDIDQSELKVDTFRAAGAGGQHVNKTDSAIRITHLPTGITVECQDERSQHQNRVKAMRLLRARLLDKLQQEQKDQISQDRRNQVGSGDRSERIRTYNFPQNRVTDHRASLTLYKLELIMQGNLELLLDPLIQHIKTQAAEIPKENS